MEHSFCPQGIRRTEKEKGVNIWRRKRLVHIGLRRRKKRKIYGRGKCHDDRHAPGVAAVAVLPLHILARV